MAMEKEDLEALVSKAFPEAVIEIVDTVGDKDHYAVHVVSEAFRGKSRLEQHRMVFEALDGHMKQALHALSIKTSLP